MSASAARLSSRRVVRVAVAAVTACSLGVATLGAAHAQESDASKPVHKHVRPIHVADAHPLTVHRRIYRPAPVVVGEGDDGPGFVRAWDDPRLTEFFGWRLGGDNFYGDSRGDTITRGNTTLGAIAGYGPARGGYGGPHFDSVGGFHNGPGPEAQEDADYATGSISTPVYDVPTPDYPSVKQQVADLDTGIVGTGQVRRQRSAHERWAELYRARALPVSYDGGPTGPEPRTAFPDF